MTLCPRRYCGGTLMLMGDSSGHSALRCILCGRSPEVPVNPATARPGGTHLAGMARSQHPLAVKARLRRYRLNPRRL